MKIIEFIKRLEEIGYDENTELTFSCCDGDTGEYYNLEIDTLDGDGFCYGEDLDGKPYDNREINVAIAGDGCKEYINAKQYEANEVLNKIKRIIYEYDYYMRYRK